MGTTVPLEVNQNITPSSDGNLTGEVDPFTPCPRLFPEVVVGLVFAVAIIASNIACMKLRAFTKTYKKTQHPESKYFVFNLAISNILCGVALLITNLLDLMSHLRTHKLPDDVCLQICTIWAPIYIFCVMIPYVVLATLGVDIAYYCHHSMDYHRRMTKWKLRISLASGWIYTLLIVGVAFGTYPKILCDKSQWEVNIFFIIFPISLMLLPACFVVAIFAHTIRLYWVESKRLARNMRVFKIGQHKETKAWLVRKFLRKFAHLIVFSILCGLMYTVLTVAEVCLETSQHKRFCILYRMDRVFISLNSFLSPWIYGLSVKNVFRKRKSSVSSSVRTTLTRFGSSRRFERMVQKISNTAENKPGNTVKESSPADAYQPTGLAVLAEAKISLRD